MRPARRLRHGVLLRFGPLVASVVDGPVDGVVVLRAEEGSFAEAVAAVGLVPLPPYFHGQLADSERYQTVYGDRAGSAAAPTAGLHFTDTLLTTLEQAGIGLASVELDIGLDTFRPIATPHLGEHQMHRERISVGADVAAAIAAVRATGGRVVAVGTTVVRALEAAATGDGLIEPVQTDTPLFITPGYPFTVVDLLLTNFHAPGTTLVVLLAAFMGPRWRDTYSLALERGYRFLSFGDSMLAERA
jgi:S-adenosylmethionine:tRNA ribosyltransferase-isomerase